MEAGTVDDNPAAIARLIAESEIRAVCLRYCRGIDRRDFDIVRDCYHPDALDEHGDVVGTVEEFIDHARAELSRFETTTHFVGNILVEVDLDGHRARCETYTIAMHRLAARADVRPERDHVVGLRYIDDFEKRDNRWRIADRVCVFDWTRTDPVVGWQFTDAFRRGGFDGTDPVFAPSLRAVIDQARPQPPTTGDPR